MVGAPAKPASRGREVFNNGRKVDGERQRIVNSSGIKVLGPLLTPSAIGFAAIVLLRRAANAGSLLSGVGRRDARVGGSRRPEAVFYSNSTPNAQAERQRLGRRYSRTRSCGVEPRGLEPLTS